MADREFLLKVVGDVSDAQKSIGRLEQDVSGFKKTAGTIGKSIVGAIAVDQIVQAGQAVVQAASDQEQAIGALTSVFGEYSLGMEKFGDTTAKAMGISKAEFSQLAAVTGSMLKNAGVPLDQVADKTKILTGRASDMAAMFGGTVPDAMNAITSALKGELDPIERYGVSVKAATVEAKAMSMGIVEMTVDADKLKDAQEGVTKANVKYTKAVAEHGAESEQAKEAALAQEKAERKLEKVMEGKVPDLTAAQKAQATYAVIMEQSSDAAGTFAKESGTLAGQQAIMSAQFKDTQAQIGQMLMPTMLKLAGVLKVVLDYVQANVDWLLPLAGAITGIVVAVKAWQVAQGAWSAATKIATAVQWAFNAAMTANPIGLIIAAVAALVAGFVLLYTKVDWFREAVDTAVQAVWTALQWLWQWIQDNWPILLAVLTGPFGAAVVLIVKNWDTIKGAIMFVYNWIKDNWPTLLAVLTGPFGLAVLAITRNWDTIKDFFYRLPGILQGYLSNVWNIVKYPFEQAANAIKDAFEPVKDFFYKLPGQINQWLSNVGNIIKYPFEQAFNGIKWLWNNTVGKISFTVPDWVPGIGGKGWSAPRLAEGGIVSRPTLALIGEAGPEAVVPLGRSGGTGFGNTTINVYAMTANAEVGRRVYEALREYERTSGKAI